MIDIKLELDKNQYNKVKDFFWKDIAVKSIKDWIRRTTLFLEVEATKRTPVDTWLLRASHRVSFSNSWFTWSIKNTRLYWLFVHNWTKYQKSQPWMSNTVKENDKQIQTVFNYELNKLFNKLK